MNTQAVLFTHKGWFGMCPVYFAELGSEAPYVEPRHACVAWLMPLSEFFYDMVFMTCSFFDPTFEAFWPLKVTGELSTPKRIACDGITTDSAG